MINKENTSFYYVQKNIISITNNSIQVILKFNILNSYLKFIRRFEASNDTDSEIYNFRFLTIRYNTSLHMIHATIFISILIRQQTGKKTALESAEQ